VPRARGILANELWQFVGGAPLVNHSPVSPGIGHDAEANHEAGTEKAAYHFVGHRTICYAFMQATGMVMDHTTLFFAMRPCRALNRPPFALLRVGYYTVQRDRPEVVRG